MSDLNRSAWGQLLAEIEAPTFGTVTRELEDDRGWGYERAADTLEAAIDDGPLCVTSPDDAANFGKVQLTDTDATDASEDGETGDDPQGEDGDTGEDTLTERAHAAFADAIEFYQGRLETELPVDYADTARDYYENCRGWSPETIEQKQLGYAPGDSGSELVAFLHRRGHNRDAIQHCGLFYEDEYNTGLTAHFSGRFVLPYFDRDGTPVYAISRSLDESNDGHPADQYGNQKYTKALKAKDYTKLDEPIYGVDTVSSDTDRLLVAGGIADAITLHQAGYACISPVTTVRFKNKHESRVASLVDEFDISGVFMLNDAERPSVDQTELGDETADKIRDSLTIKQYGEGLRGAFGNAEFLLDEGIDPFLVTLPGGDDDLRKIDPDDFIQDNWGSVDTLLASARHADDHPGYQQWCENRQSRQLASAQSISNTDGGSPNDGRSALFSLEFTDVAQLSDGDRVNNPLGHHGDSTGYFVVIDKSGETFGYDHKYNVAYNALTYLLCDAGERRASDPNGRLNDEEVFAAWKHAKQSGCISKDDKIPTRALGYVARDATDWDGEKIERETADGETFDALPRGTYNAAVEHIEATHGVDTGRELLTGWSEDAEPVAALGIERLEALDPADRRRAAQKRGYDVPATREARQRLRDSVFREMRAENQTVLDAPTALGKSYTVATEPWLRRDSTTGGAPVIQLHATTDARDEAAAETNESMAEGAVLRGRDEMSPVARGDHDPNPDGEDPDTVVTIDGLPASEWFDNMCDEKGLAFSTALALGRDRNDQGHDELPPFGREDPAVAQWDGVPRDSDGETAVDVVHATHQFAHVPSMRAHTNLVLDEQPDFRRELEQDTIRSMVTAYLHRVDAPVTNWESFVVLAQHDYNDDAAAAERDALTEMFTGDIDTPDPEWYVSERDAHALAPAITEALWWAFQSDADRNERRSAKTRHEPPRFDADSSDAATSQVRVVVDADNTVQTVRETPHLYRARSVVGLDAHPAMPLWELNTTPRMTRDRVLGPTERRLWRVVERGLTVVQVGDATRPRSGEKAREWMNNDRVRAVLQRLREQYGDGFKTALSTVQTELELEELLREVCESSVIDGDNTMHFGEEKSRNDFAGEQAGYVYGAMDPGDDMVVNTLAELDLDAAPVTATDDDGEIIRDDDGEPVREKGRTFEGDDADTAASVLASVRENHVAQAAGRYARDADSDDGATVFVHTDAAPTGFVDVETPGVEWLATEKQRQVIDALEEGRSSTAAEIADRDSVDCSKSHVLKTLKKLEGENVVDRHAGGGYYGADLFTDDGATPVVVDVGDSSADNALCTPYRWVAALEYPHDGDTATIDDSPGQSAGRGGSDSGEWRGESQHTGD